MNIGSLFVLFLHSHKYLSALVAASTYTIIFFPLLPCFLGVLLVLTVIEEKVTKTSERIDI